MVSNIHIREHWFPISGLPNVEYLNDIPSITIVLGIQPDNKRETIT